MNCEECGTRNADVLPSRGDCQTCLKARLDALTPRDTGALVRILTRQADRYLASLPGPKQ